MSILNNRKPVGPLRGLMFDWFQKKQEFRNLPQEQTYMESTNEEDPLLKAANKWYEKITKKGAKRKMMKHYMQSTTSLSDEEIEERLNRAKIY